MNAQQPGAGATGGDGASGTGEGSAPEGPAAPEGLAARIAALMPRAKADLAELVAIPSVADPRQYPPEECRRAAQWVADAVTEAGLHDVHLAETPDGSAAVLGHRPGPPGAPTVLLYCHYDVQPPLDDRAWRTPPFELTERDDGRWYGRGAADCKGNIVMHLTALRALGDDLPVNVKFVAEGSEEQGTGGLERYVAANRELFTADALLVCDTGNTEAGTGTATVSLRGLVSVVVTVETLSGEVHSGMFGGPAPDALAALVHLLATLRDPETGGTRVQGVPGDGRWKGEDYDAEQFRKDAGVLDGVPLTGTGSVADRLWARPAVTVLGIDCPPVVGSAAAVPATARARVSLRIPPGLQAHLAERSLMDHLANAAPWGVRVTVEPEAAGEPFAAVTDGPAYRALDEAMRKVYGKPMALVGQGGSIPLCNVLSDSYPRSEIILMGVEEPLCLIHAPNESVDPAEIQHMAEVEARFLTLFGASHR